VKTYSESQKLIHVSRTASSLINRLCCNIYTMFHSIFRTTYLSRNVRGFIHIRRICGEKLSNRPSVKGNNSSKSTNRKILTLGTSRHYHLALCNVSSTSVDKCRSSCGFRHTDRHTDKLLTNQDKHPKIFGSLIISAKANLLL
jgi:hypothetical protein